MLVRHVALTFAMILAVLVGSPSWAQEDSFECRQGELLRSVMIVYDVPGEAVPCQVVYSKPTEGAEDQVLWSAANESGYCEFKAKEFRAQLESWGWVCAGETPEPVEEQLGDDAPSDPAAE